MGNTSFGGCSWIQRREALCWGYNWKREEVWGFGDGSLGRFTDSRYEEKRRGLDDIYRVSVQEDQGGVVYRGKGYICGVKNCEGGGDLSMVFYGIRWFGSIWKTERM